MTAQKKDAQAVAQEKALKDAATQVEVEEAAPRKGYYVAPKCALTSLRGIIGEGEEIKASDFAKDGENVLADWVKRKKVIHVK